MGMFISLLPLYTDCLRKTAICIYVQKVKSIIMDIFNVFCVQLVFNDL